MVRITQPLSASRRRADRGLKEAESQMPTKRKNFRRCLFWGGKRQESSARLAIRRRFDEKCLLALTKKKKEAGSWLEKHCDVIMTAWDKDLIRSLGWKHKGHST